MNTLTPQSHARFSVLVCEAKPTGLWPIVVTEDYGTRAPSVSHSIKSGEKSIGIALPALKRHLACLLESEWRGNVRQVLHEVLEEHDS